MKGIQERWEAFAFVRSVWTPFVIKISTTNIFWYWQPVAPHSTLLYPQIRIYSRVTDAWINVKHSCWDLGVLQTNGKRKRCELGARCNIITKLQRRELSSEGNRFFNRFTQEEKFMNLKDQAKNPEIIFFEPASKTPRYNRWCTIFSTPIPQPCQVALGL